MRPLFLLSVLSLATFSGCGNPGGLSDAEYAAKLRSEREEYNRQWERADAAAERAIAEARERQ
jgi:hypothetical protein